MGGVLLTVTTTHEPATDLGYLLVKHPDRVHRVDLPLGTATVCYPEASSARCTAALLLEAQVDPRTNDTFALGRYVNDRSYAASSLLASALNRVFRTAMRGDSKERPDLAATAIPLEIHIPVLRCRGGAAMVERLFAPLGWRVETATIPLDESHPEWGASQYLDVTLTGTLRLADALNHIYVLLPVLDDAKHYWVSPDEIDKLLRAGEGWVRLLQSALTYADDRLVGYDAAVLMEVIEHVDADRLPALVANVFGHAGPSYVIVTTPNVEYNARYAGLAEGALRHHDHRFEWTRGEFAEWCAGICADHPYAVEIRGVGDIDADLGTPTQMGIFRRAAEPDRELSRASVSV